MDFLKELFHVNGCGIDSTHLAPYRRYDPRALREPCRQALSPHLVLEIAN